MKKRGVISLVFDDGYETIYRNVVPLLNELKMPGVFAVPLDNEAITRTEDRATVSWQQWLDIGSSHEIAAHGISHRGFGTLDDKELQDELALPAQELSAQTVVYPGGAVTNDIARAAAQYYRAGRTTAFGLETLPPQDVMLLKTVNYTKNNFSVIKANVRALWACLAGKWLIETYHIIDDQETGKVHAIRLTDFKRHLQFIAHLPIEIKTIAAVTSRYE